MSERLELFAKSAVINVTETAQPLVDQRARSAMRVKLKTLAARIEAQRREFPELSIELQLAEAAEALATALKQPDSDGARAVDFAHRALAAASFRF